MQRQILANFDNEGIIVDQAFNPSIQRKRCVWVPDVTELAHAIKEAIANKQKQLPLVPEERVYEVSPQIQQTLPMS